MYNDICYFLKRMIKMGFLISLIPLNAIPIAFIVLKVEGILPKDFMNDTHFIIAISGFLMLTLSIEMVKAAFFAPKGSSIWVDFIMSFLLFMAIIAYIMYIIFKLNKTPDPLYFLALEAQFLDVLVGFYIAISNARRDFNTSG